jgi:hypothetical protein
MPTTIKSQRRESKRTERLLALFCAALSVLMCVAVAEAQSGRTVRRNPSSPNPPTENPTPTPTPVNTSTTPPRREFTFNVARYVQGPTVAVESSIAFNSFVERLGKSLAVEVVPVHKDMTRKEAIDRAKSEESENAYVVWLRLEVDTPDMERADAGMPLNPGCLYVSYTVYSPRTAKIKAQGKVYQRGYASNSCLARTGSPIPRREPPHLPSGYRIQMAGSDAADRVLQAFNLPLPHYSAAYHR